MNIFEKIIRSLGKTNYTIDPSLSKRGLFIILFERGVSLIRGLYYRMFFHSVEGMLFVGRRCKIQHAYNISAGRTLIIEDNVNFNALSKGVVTIGNNVTIKRNTIIECTGIIKELGGSLVIGDHVGISQNCFIQVRGQVTIGSYVMFGPGVSVFSENHSHDDPNEPMIFQKTIHKGVTIGNNVWIGAGSIILDGVTIGDGCIVGAGSVVTRSIPPDSIAFGVPAKVVMQKK